MKKTFFYLIAFTIITFPMFYACNSGKSSKMTGVWTVDNVDAQFDETKVNPQTLQQVIEMEKQTMLKFIDDSTMNIIMGESTFRTYWNLDKETGKLFYRFEDTKTNYNELGVLIDGVIVAESTTPVGKIKVSYKKTK
ncbi:MAG: hypothetical protein Q7V19_07200 [Bacteroidales bacterium]|nr:hypothetical protein [Bacteroidales bacterium]MDP2238179.1 hypothetical protein [Bacteroidales bacterium]